MKLPSLSLRTRILLWHCALLACVLAAFGFTAHRLHWEGELARTDRGLDEPLSLLHRSLREQSAREGLPPGLRSMPPESFTPTKELAESLTQQGVEFCVWSRSGEMLAHSSKMPATRTMPTVKGVVPFVIQRRSHEGRREAFLITPPGECFLVAVSMQNEQEAAARLGWWLIILGLSVLGAGLLVDAWILQRAIQPVEEIINAAERIAQGNLSTRIETQADGTELDRLTKVLNHTFTSLEQAFTQQARFSADVAHELRTPVSVLMAEAQGLLERERSADEYRESIATTLRISKRMSGLIESLLELAQIESQPDLSREACDLATLCTEALPQLEGMAKAQGIHWQRSLESAPCQGNTSQLTQVVANLLVNAIQHNHSNGEVRLQTGTREGRSFLRVENTGPGIPERDLPHVFERFYPMPRGVARLAG